jgi:glycosyltransferase involved in cell wall biosynthesis
VSRTPERAVVLLVPGDINLRTGGYGYDRAIVAGLRELGWHVDIRALDDSFPFPCEDARADAARALAALPDDTLVLADGLAFGAMAAEAEREASRLRLVALVHHPLALETGLDPEAARALKESETRALHAARGVIVTGAATVQSLQPYGIAPGSVAVVRPGTPGAPLASGTRGIEPPRQDVAAELLCVASLTSRKGHDVLFQALSRLAHLPWHLTCAGSPHLHPETAAALASQLLAAGLGPRVTFVGELDEARLASAYDRADAFVLATRHEGYGMAVAEAVARGLPVVSTPTGAIPELVDAASGIIVPIDDVEALTQAIEVVLNDAVRARLTEGAQRRRAGLPTWSDAARQMAAALAGFADHGIVQR